MPRNATTLGDLTNRRKRPRRATVWVPLDPDKGDEFVEESKLLEEYESRVALAPTIDQFVQDRDDQKAKVDELRDELRKPENSLRFVFEALAPRDYDKLLTQHQPSDERKEEMRAKGIIPEQIGFDPDTFPQALVAKCCVEPEGLTPELVDAEIVNSADFTRGDWLNMYRTVLDLNTRPREIRLGKGSSSTKS